jgi:hypothetical protein
MMVSESLSESVALASGQDEARQIGARLAQKQAMLPDHK